MKTLPLTLSLLALGIFAMPLSASADKGHMHFQGFHASHQQHQPVHHRKHKPYRQQARFLRKSEKRLENQEDRILHGLINGRLTNKEARRLVNQHARMERLQDRIESDGRITKQERKRFNRLTRKSSRTIYHLKANQRDAYRSHIHRTGY